MSGLDAILNRQGPSLWRQFCYSPKLFFTRWAYSTYVTLLDVQQLDKQDRRVDSPIRVVCISDTHNAHERVPPLPPGDILIYAGDLTNSGSETELREALQWLSGAPHKYKLFIAGNHDTVLAHPTKRDRILAAYPDLIYLEDSSTTLVVNGRTITVYGSPYTPRHGSGVFQYPRGGKSSGPLGRQRDIPPSTDILITHGPPRYHLDSRGYGCVELGARLWDLRPRLHVFGHIHAGRGVSRMTYKPIQRKYEDVCAGTAGWVAVMQIVLDAIYARLGQRTLFQPQKDTVLVNAASLGGIKDDLVRGAIIVDLLL
ncbi:Metallo-dependent phosphatase [Trametes meyenii]|nr:Metallo-dependent phosphatase [Trametes meyenii]